MSQRAFDAVAFDLDDTLLRDDLTISQNTLSVLRQAAARGVAVVPASGRAWESMRPFVRQMDFTRVCIACNGAEVWDTREEKLLARQTFPLAVADAIVDFGSQRGFYLQTYWEGRFHYNEEGEWARSYAASSMITGCLTPDVRGFIATHPTSKILMMAAPEDIASALQEARAQFAGQASVTCSKPYFLEFNPPEATKGNALARCAALLSFSLERAVAFGDSLNDLSMLTAVGLGVAVANAREEVRARCAAVCGSNNDDGVAIFLTEHLGEAAQ